MKKIAKKAKKATVSKLKKQLMELVKGFVRTRDKFTCQHCSKKVLGQDCHVSHVIPVSHGKRLAFEPLNMKVLCYHCHLNWWHKNPLEASEWFVKRFPERSAWLESHKNEIVKWNSEDYQIKIDEAKLGNF